MLVWKGNQSIPLSDNHQQSNNTRWTTKSLSSPFFPLNSSVLPVHKHHVDKESKQAINLAWTLLNDPYITTSEERKFLSNIQKKDLVVVKVTDLLNENTNNNNKKYLFAYLYYMYIFREALIMWKVYLILLGFLIPSSLRYSHTIISYYYYYYYAEL